jgi:hypothetical protein
MNNGNPLHTYIVDLGIIVVSVSTETIIMY